MCGVFCEVCEALSGFLKGEGRFYCVCFSLCVCEALSEEVMGVIVSGLARAGVVWWIGERERETIVNI